MQPGEVLADRYRLIARLGEGGMGEVWRAEQIALGREVAVKLVHGERGDELPDARERFRREAELAAKIEHRNVIGIVDYGTTDGGTQYLVMPLLRGESLQERLRRSPPPSVAELLGWMRGVLSGLGAIHGKGIVHRDLKPANVFLAQDADGVVPKLLDFGISRHAGASEGAGLTKLGTAIGTPQYMAPEQFESAKDVDARADVFCAGAILYEALAGRPAFEGADAFAIYRAILEGAATPLASLRPELAGVGALADRALARDPSARFQSARAMRDALDALLASGELGADAVKIADTIPRSDAGIAPTAAMPVGQTSAMPGRATISKGNGVARTQAMDGAVAPTLAAGPITPAALVAPAPRSRLGPLLGGAAVIVLAAAAGGWWWLGREGTPAPTVLASAPPDASILADAGPAALAPPVAPAPPPGLAVSRENELTVLATSWAEAPEPLRACEIRFVPALERWLAVVPASSEARCTAGLARIFGATRTAPRDYDPQLGLRPSVLRSTVRLNVHTAPSIDSASSHVLPNDGVVVGLYGQARGATSSAEGEGALTFFAVSEGTVGWASARYLAPFHGCLPSSADIADDLAEELGPADEEDLDVEDPLERADRILANAITARTHVFFDGRRQDAFVLASSDDEARESVVLVYRLDADCAITRLGAHWLPGLLDEHFLTETMVGGGETLVVASYASRDTRAADGLYDWVARRIDSSQDLWQSRLRTQANVPERQRVGIGGTRDRIARSRQTPFVLAVREPDQERLWYVWRDGAVVLEGAAAAPAPAPPIEQPNLE